MPPKTVPLTWGPFLGMRYKADPSEADPRFAMMAQDMVPSDPVLGGPYVRRPSDQGTTVKAATATTFQHMGVFRKRAGFVGVAVIDGEIYTLAGTTWTRVVTTANLTTASITMSATARVFCVTYNNTYIVNDGVNQPFSWDGTTGAGGLTLLSNAPTKCYGKPAVYYGKLVFIKNVAANNVDRAKIVWSEENAANTGYEAGGYANVWQLTQNGEGSLYAVRGTNSGLYYFREDGIGVIHGAITPAFTTTGVHDDVSSIIGTTCPDVLWYEKYLYFFDQRGRPWRCAEGGVPEPIYLELADLYTTPDTPGQGLVNLTAYDASKSNVAAFPWLDGVVFGAYNSSLSLQPIKWLFSHRTGRCLCRVAPQISGSNTQITGATYDTTNSRAVIGFGWVVGSVATAAVCPVVSGSFFDHTDSGGLQFSRFVTVGPFGPGNEVSWLFNHIGVTAAIGATSSGRTGTIGVSISTAETPFGNFTSQGTQTFPASTTYQSQGRKVWDIKQDLRWMAVAVVDGGGYEGWGVYQVNAHGQPKLAPAKKT